MRNAVFSLFFVCLAIPVAAQSVTPSPIANTEIRDNGSIRMRSLEFERVKRDFFKNAGKGSPRDALLRFERFKQDFEGLQKTQDRIVKTYTTGATINLSRIARLSAELSKKALRLYSNLFGTSSDLNREKDAAVTKGVRDLIIDLDDAVGDFVTSPFFADDKLVDQRISEKTQADLRRVIDLSISLAGEAKKR
jgi:hypothetical protein